MYQFGDIGDYDEGECTIWRFTIDRRCQNIGIGKIVVRLLLEKIKAPNRCSLLDIDNDPKNVAAQKLYSGCGFKVVGERDDGDLIAELRL